MEESKVNFLYPPPSPVQSPTIAQANFVINPICPISPCEIGINNFNVSPRQVPISQIYTSRKIKHPSFRKRASSGSMPYYIPFRHRQRTKSESADVNTQTAALPDSVMDCETNVNEKLLTSMDMDAPPLLHQIGSSSQFNKIKTSQLKKSKSMESLILTKVEETESKVNSSSSTLEFVSSRIQKLKFNE